MAFLKKDSKDEKRTTEIMVTNNNEYTLNEKIAIIAEETVIEGNLNMKNDAHIYGKVKGILISSGDVIVGVKGEIEGDVIANRIVIAGVIKGKIKTTELEIMSEGRAEGEVSYKSLIIDKGGVLEGTTKKNLVNEDEEKLELPEWLSNN